MMVYKISKMVLKYVGSNYTFFEDKKNRSAYTYISKYDTGTMEGKPKYYAAGIYQARLEFDLSKSLKVVRNWDSDLLDDFLRNGKKDSTERLEIIREHIQGASIIKIPKTKLSDYIKSPEVLKFLKKGGKDLSKVPLLML